MKNIICATISLDNVAGGLERNIIYLVNELANRGYKVHLISFDHKEAVSFYKINKKVIWHKIGIGTPHNKISFTERLQLIRNIRNVIKKNAPQTPIICYSHGILLRFFLGSIFLNCPLICSERNSLSMYSNIKKTRKININYLLLYLTKAITVQLPIYIQDYHKLLRKKIRVIANPVFPVNSKVDVAKPSQNGRYTILTVTRLCRQKNLEQLITAYSLIAHKNPKWDLKIVGDGSYYDILQKLIKKLDMQKRIYLLGHKKNVAVFYNSSHIFCLPSQWEGFPNSLAEALSYGLPAIGYDDCSGVNQLIKHGYNGLLAKKNGDINTLADTMDLLINDKKLRISLGEKTLLSIKQYTPNKVFDKWERLIITI